MATQGLPVKKKALDKVRKPLAGVSALVDLWWQGVWQDVPHVALTPMGKSWGEEVLLPLMSWQLQVSRTRCPRRTAKILQALKAVQNAFAQFIAVCSASTLTEELRISRPFSSQSREKREVSLRRTHTRI